MAYKDKIKEFEKKIHKNEIFLWIILGTLIFIGLLIYIPILYSLSFNYNTNIEYVGLNESQINYIEKILSEVKPLYLERIKEITFYNESFILRSDKSIKGYNSNRNIKLIYSNSFKTNLCHELLHNWIYEEEPVYDIAEYDVCYKGYIIYKKECNKIECKETEVNEMRFGESCDENACGSRLISKKDITKEFLDENCECIKGLHPTTFCSIPNENGTNSKYCGYNGTCIDYWCNKDFGVKVN